jgi:hypothetical protein
MAEFLRANVNVNGSAFCMLEAAHISNVEQPAVYTDTVTNFLTQPAR